MILPLLILAAQVPSTPISHGVPPGSGAELMVQCIAAEGLALTPTSVSRGDQVEKGALCIGYIEGYSDGTKVDVCIPPHSLMAVISSYVRYMQNHPKYYEMPKATGLRAAIDATYPCRK